MLFAITRGISTVAPGTASTVPTVQVKPSSADTVEIDPAKHAITIATARTNDKILLFFMIHFSISLMIFI